MWLLSLKTKQLAQNSTPSFLRTVDGDAAEKSDVHCDVTGEVNEDGKGVGTPGEYLTQRTVCHNLRQQNGNRKRHLKKIYSEIILLKISNISD